MKLETSDSSLVDNIYKVIVTDSMIYIFDDYKGGGLVLFNSNGKFIKTQVSDLDFMPFERML